MNTGLWNMGSGLAPSARPGTAAEVKMLLRHSIGPPMISAGILRLR